MYHEHCGSSLNKGFWEISVDFQGLVSINVNTNRCSMQKQLALARAWTRLDHEFVHDFRVSLNCRSLWHSLQYTRLVLVFNPSLTFSILTFNHWLPFFCEINYLYVCWCAMFPSKKILYTVLYVLSVVHHFAWKTLISVPFHHFK